jgi:hypothetical protein
MDEPILGAVNSNACIYAYIRRARIEEIDTGGGPGCKEKRKMTCFAGYVGRSEPRPYKVLRRESYLAETVDR